MKLYLKIFITLIAFAHFSLAPFAQTQTGIVKTKGRLGANGSVVSGKRLPGASVKVQGRNAVLSNNNGVFTFPVPGQRFSLVSASKTGYVLTDPDILMRQHTYSGQNPVFVVMETPETQLEDQLASERKIRRNLSQKLAAREQEIEQLKNENKITKQEYQKLMQELYASQESNEKLIKDMAKRYASMDYDQLDDLNRRVQAYILDGNLIAADSLINSKGDIVTRANNIKREQKLIAAEKKELTERLKVVSQLETGSNLDIEDIAKDCMHKAEIHKFNLSNDSAAFYLELRADIDTLNVDWQIDAGEFFRDALADYDRAQFYMTRIERIANNNADKALQYRCFMLLGQTNLLLTKLSEAEYYLNKALMLSEEVYGSEDINYIETRIIIGDLFESKNNYQQAWEIYKQGAFYFYNKIQRNSHDSIPLSLEELNVYSKLVYSICGILRRIEKFYSAIKVFVELEKLCLNYYKADTPFMASIYENLGSLYQEINNNEKALEYLSKAYMINLKYYSENHPIIAVSRLHLSEVLASTGDFQQAIENASHAYSNFSSKFGSSCVYLADAYKTFGLIYFKKGEYTTSIENYLKGLEILELFYGSGHSSHSIFYKKLADVYDAKQDSLQADIYRVMANICTDEFLYYLKSSINEEKLVKENTHPQK